MKLFLKKITIYLLIFLLMNIVIGKFLEVDLKMKARQKCFYPPLRWNEFYSKEKKSLDIIFLGSSHSYRTYNPVIVDSVASIESFNLSSSIQTVATSYYLLVEALKYQNPRIVFLDVFPFTLNYHQLDAINYNFPYIKSSSTKYRMFWNGLNFKEKIQFIVPIYSKRNSFFSSLRFLFFPNYEINTDELYVEDGFVTSLGSLDQNQINDTNPNNWEPTSMTKFHLTHLEKITDLCDINGISLIITRTPTARKVYDNLDDFDRMIHKFADEYSIEYINFDEYAKKQLNFNDFKDVGHLNYQGSKKISIQMGKYILMKLHQ